MPILPHRRFNIQAASALLHRKFRSSGKNEFEAYRDLRDLGLTWIAIKAWCDDPDQHGGFKISPYEWARNRENSPIGGRWLDDHAKFARDEWKEFVKAWKWSQAKAYAPESRPGLQTARDLIAAKKRADTYGYAIVSSRSAPPEENISERSCLPVAGQKIIVRPGMTILCGEVTQMLREHIADETIPLVIADPAWFLRIPDHQTPTDWCYDHYNMTERFRAEWDKFDSVDEYVELAEQWLTEVRRVLRPDGSVFIMGGFHNIGLVNYVLQSMGMNIVQDIAVTKTNGRPTVNHPGLQFSHFSILWATRSRTGHRFNYADCKRATYPKDPFNNIRGQMMRDTWFIQNNGRQTQKRFQAQKVIEIYDRILTVAGEPAGTMIDLFAGSGTGAIAAMRWGMKSISIERDPQTVADIIERIKAEPQRR